MQDDSINSKYHVLKVEKTMAPEGMPGENWFLYVIQKGSLKHAIMTCKKTGTLKSVTEHAEEMATTINSRNVKGSRK